MNFLSVLYAKAGITVDGVTALNNTATALTPTTSDNSTKIATTAFVKNQNYYPYPTGTTSQYVRGDGSLATFPTVASEAKTLITEVYNESGATMTKGTVVLLSVGHGNLPTIVKALASSDATSAQTYGVVQNDITDNNNGFVVVIGLLENLATNAYVDGTILYLSPTTAGQWTSTKPYAPQHLVYVGMVVRAHPTQGVVAVRIQNGYEMDELHNVSAQSPANGDILQFNFSTQLWTKTTGNTTAIAEGTNLYFTDARARAAISLTTTGTSGAATYVGGVLNIPQYQAALTNPVTGTGTTNYITKWVSGSAVGNSIIYDNGTNVGIGTTSPNAKLDVLGASNDATSYGTFYFKNDSNTGISFGSYSTSYSWIQGNRYGVGVVPIVLQVNGGNVGIGTTSPTVRLQVENNSHNYIQVNSSVANVQTAINVTNSASTNRASLSWEDGTRGAYADLYSSTYLTLTTQSSEKMRITSAGNVGIGTTSPSTAFGRTLTINGASTRGILLQESGTDSGFFYSDSAYLTIGSNAGGITFKSADTERMRIAASGNVLIGTTSGSFPLTVVGKIGANIFSDSYLEFSSSGHVILKANNDVFVGYSQNFVVTQGGNVGIGTTSPNTKLDVSGSISLAGTDGLRIGSVGDNSAYDNVKLYYSGYNGGAPRVYLTPRTTPGSGVIQTYFHLLNSNGSSTSSNNTMGLLVDGNVGIGATSPDTKLEVANGLIRVRGAESDQYFFEGVRTGVSTTLRIYDNASNVYYDSYRTMVFRANQNGGSAGNILLMGGNVGVGTTSPATTLHVAQNNGAITLTRESGLYGTKITQSNSDGSINYQIGLATAGAWSTYMKLGEGETSPALMLQPYGNNVLIGTTTDAGYKLDVNGSGRFVNQLRAYSVLSDNQIKGSAYVELSPDQGTYNAWNIRVGAQAADNCYYITGGGVNILTTEGYNNPYTVKLYSNGIQTLTMTNGAATFSSSVSVGGDVILGDYATATTKFLDFRTSNSVFTIATDGTAGNLGTSISYSWANGGQGPLRFNNAAGEVMRLSAGGNVLIGTTTDAGYKLDVNGTARVSGNAYFGTFNNSNKYLFEPFSNLAGGANNAYLVSGKADNNERSGFVLQARNSTGEEYNAVIIEGYNSTATNTPFTIDSTGAATLSSLSGSGSRMVIADASGNLSTQAIPSGSITGSGTAGYITKWTSGTAIGNSAITDDGTTITLISRALSGTSATFSGNANADDYSIAAWKILDWTGSVAQIGGISASQWNQLEFFTSGTSKLTITSAGNVGIGTTSPSARLSLGAASQGQRITWEDYSNIFSEYSSGDLWLSSNFYGVSGSSGYKTSITATYGAAGISVSGTGGGLNGVLKFFADDAASKTAGDAFTPTERMRITGGGSVGIGTTSPSEKLEVKGADSSTVQAIFQSTVSTNVAYNGGIQLGNAGSNQNSQIYHSSAGDNTLTFVSNYSSGTTNKFIFAPGGTERVRFFQNGNVLIGTTTDAGYKLDVNGTARVSGVATFSGSISSNRAAQGNINGINYFTAGTANWYVGSSAIGSNTDMQFYNHSAGVVVFNIANTTGAATFSSTVTASLLIKSGGTSAQFLKADGSVDSNTYVTSGALAGYLPLTGGTLSGDLTVNTKVYVGTHGCYFEEVLIGSTYELRVVDSAGNMTIIS